MSENPLSSEKLGNVIACKTFLYQSRGEARRVYENVDLNSRLQMASVYKDAFGGPPWFERFVCPICGAYERSQGECPNCGKEPMNEAYPTDYLVKDYFPQMVAKFTPGCFITATDQNGVLKGFSTGGYTTLESLVATKYDSNSQILRSIAERTKIRPGTGLFYDNETCIDPKYQKQKIGRKLSEERQRAAISLGADLICGRSINLPWINLKQRQLEELGYDFTFFRPDGDTYQVDDLYRYFYLARKVTS